MKPVTRFSFILFALILVYYYGVPRTYERGTPQVCYRGLIFHPLKSYRPSRSSSHFDQSGCCSPISFHYRLQLLFCFHRSLLIHYKRPHVLLGPSTVSLLLRVLMLYKACSTTLARMALMLPAPILVSSLQARAWSTQTVSPSSLDPKLHRPGGRNRDM